MKQVIDMIKNKRLVIFNLFCLIMAVVTGGAYAMAVAEVEDGSEIAGANMDVCELPFIKGVSDGSGC